MRAHEAIAILEAVDPDLEVTLKISNTIKPKVLRGTPFWFDNAYRHKDVDINKPNPTYH